MTRDQAIRSTRATRRETATGAATREKRARRFACGARAAAALATVVGAYLVAGPASAEAQACSTTTEAARAQQGSSYLPECRAFELASPVLKNGEEVLVPEVHGQEVPFQAARAGGGVAFMTIGALPGSSSGGFYDQYLAERSEQQAGSGEPRASWKTLSLQPESRFLESYTGEGSTGETEYYAPDLSCGIEQTELPQPEHSGETKLQLPEGETAAERIINLYVWHAGAGTGGAPTLESTKLISSEKPANAAESERGTTFSVDGATAGCKRVIFESEYRFLGAPAGTLYEWVEGAGRDGGGLLRVASVLGERENAHHEKEAIVAQAVSGAGMGEKQSDLNELTSEVAESGEEVSRVVFTAIAETGPNLGHEEVFLRETRTAPGSEAETSSTVELSASQGSSSTDTGARFEAASSNGQVILFTANYGLTPETSAGSETASSCDQSPGQMGPGCDLYAYDESDHTLTDLSIDREGQTGDKKGAGVASVLGIGAKRLPGTPETEEPVVYFSASGQLVKGAGNTQAYDELTLKSEPELAELLNTKIKTECGPLGEPERQKCEVAGKEEPKFKEEVRQEHEAQQGKCPELPVRAEQERCAQLLAGDEAKLPEANVYAYQGGQTSYASTIGQKEAGGAGAQNADELDTISGQDGMHYTVSRVSPDGEYLLFATSVKVRESDGEEYDNRDQLTHEPDYEYYEYSLSKQTVTCVSCTPNRSILPIQRGPQGSSGAFQTNENGYLRRNLSEDGAVFFDSVDPLVEQATNKAVNVYEWQPDGVGGCEQGAGAPALGCVHLLDSGTNPNASYFADAGASGEDAFITTQQQLAPQDQDGLRDIYDVRAGGGILAEAMSRCSEEKCQGEYSGLGSANYTSESGVGGGNVVPQTTPPGTGKVGVAAFTAHSVSVKHTIRGTKAAVRVSAPASGRIVITGAGLRTAAKSVSKAGIYTLEVALTAKERKILVRRKHLKLTLHVAFSPASGHASTIATSVTFS